VLAVLLVAGVVAVLLLRGSRDAWADAPEVGSCYSGGPRAIEEAEAAGGVLMGASLYPWDCSDAEGWYQVAGTIDGVAQQDASHVVCEQHVGFADAVVWYDPDGKQADGLDSWVPPEDLSDAGPSDKGTLVCLQER
jgi:hypothetical protein